MLDAARRALAARSLEQPRPLHRDRGAHARRRCRGRPLAAHRHRELRRRGQRRLAPARGIPHPPQPARAGRDLRDPRRDAQALRCPGRVREGERADRGRPYGRGGGNPRRTDRAHAGRRGRLVQPRDAAPPGAGAQPRRAASRRARRALAGLRAGRALLRARQGAGGPRTVRGVLRRARPGRERAPQGALLPRRGRRAGDRLDHPHV